MSLAALIASLIACTTCGEGQIKDPISGDCLDEYVAPTSQEEARESLPECDLLPSSSRLDIEAACADGACAGMTYNEVNAALGETGDCDEPSSDWLVCHWQNDALHMYFEDADYDGQPDVDDVAIGLYLEESWSGSDESGLGLGISMRCYLDVLGEPEEIEYYVDGENIWIDQLYYQSLSAFVSDQSWEGAADHPDGIVDDLDMFGP
jgi:hypothetical protein